MEERARNLWKPDQFCHFTTDTLPVSHLSAHFSRNFPLFTYHSHHLPTATPPTHSALAHAGAAGAVRGDELVRPGQSRGPVARRPHAPRLLARLRQPPHAAVRACVCACVWCVCVCVCWVFV